MLHHQTAVIGSFSNTCLVEFPQIMQYLPTPDSDIELSFGLENRYNEHEVIIIHQQHWRIQGGGGGRGLKPPPLNTQQGRQ